MRISEANEFTFDFGELELTAYFDDSGNLIHVDTDDYDMTPHEITMVEDVAKIKYEHYLKEQEERAKDKENTEWHLNQQFKVF